MAAMVFETQFPVAEIDSSPASLPRVWLLKASNQDKRTFAIKFCEALEGQVLRFPLDTSYIDIHHQNITDSSYFKMILQNNDEFAGVEASPSSFKDR